LTEYTIKNGSGETIKLSIIVTRSPFNPNGQALQIDPRASDTAAFCNVLNSKNGPNPDGLGLKEIRRVFQQAIREQQGSLPGDVLRFADSDIGNHADDVMNHFEKACTDLAPKVSQAGSTIRMFADGGGPGGRVQSELSVLNANGALIGHTSSGPDGPSRENYDRNNAPAWSGRNVGSDVNGDWTSSPATGSGDTGSPVLRALVKYRRSAALDDPASTSAQGAPPATPAFQPDSAVKRAVPVLSRVGKFIGDSLITPAEAASPSWPLSPVPTGSNVPSEETAFGDRSENAPRVPGPDTYPRLRRVSSAFPRTAPPGPGQPAPSPERAPPLGIFSGKPMLPSPIPLSVWGLPDNSDASGNGDWFNFLAGIASWNPTPPAPPPQTAGSKPAPYLGRRIVDQSQASVSDTGAPAVPLGPSDDPNFSGGLLGRLVALMGIDPQNPTQPVPPPDDGLRGFYRDDPVQPWFVQGQR
jgi:hypothetical protein